MSEKYKKTFRNSEKAFGGLNSMEAPKPSKKEAPQVAKQDLVKRAFDDIKAMVKNLGTAERIKKHTLEGVVKVATRMVFEDLEKKGITLTAEQKEAVKTLIADALADAKTKKEEKPSKTKVLEGDIGSPEHKDFYKGGYFENGKLNKRGEKILKTVNAENSRANTSMTYQLAGRRRRELDLNPDLSVKITAEDLMKALEKK